MDNMAYLGHLRTVADQDERALRKAAEEYGASFSKRGGVGHFMMLARKWDRIEQAMVKANGLPKYDIYLRTARDQRPEGLIDDVRDLRRYLLLLEAELLARETKHASLPKDGTEPAPNLSLYQKMRLTADGVIGGEHASKGRTEHPAPFGYQGEDTP